MLGFNKPYKNDSIGSNLPPTKYVFFYYIVKESSEVANKSNQAAKLEAISS
jgi:hypothetical protein